MSLWLARQLPGGADAVVGFNKGGTVDAAGLRVTMVTAHHSAGDWNAGGDTTLYLGDPAGFVIELEDGYRIYHAGDTEPFSDMRLIRELHRPDLAMVPTRQPLHDGPGRRRAGGGVPRCGRGRAAHYGTFPISRRYACRAARRARGTRARLGPRPRARTGRDGLLGRRLRGDRAERHPVEPGR